MLSMILAVLDVKQEPAVLLEPMKKKNPHAVALGHNGGKARAQTLTTARRKEIAAMGGRAKKAKATK